MRIFFLLLSLMVGCVSAAPRLAIIIDDVGNDYAAAQKVLNLPSEVTVAILPQLGNSQRIAEQAHRRGHEVMLHQPMQPVNNKKLGPGGLDQWQSKSEQQAVLVKNLQSLPHVSGINNHMGSLLTRNEEAMKWVMQGLKQHGDLYFVDSRTVDNTQAERVARNEGIPSARRDVFLDNIAEADHIQMQLESALQLARLRGSAIAIGHPYPETLAVLAKMLPQWQEEGVVLLPVSQIIAHQRSADSWHASSSLLPQVAKNSKQ